MDLLVYSYLGLQAGPVRIGLVILGKELGVEFLRYL